MLRPYCQTSPWRLLYLQLVKKHHYSKSTEGRSAIAIQRVLRSPMIYGFKFILLANLDLRDKSRVAMLHHLES
jgi:hypothetical protein